MVKKTSASDVQDVEIKTEPTSAGPAATVDDLIKELDDKDSQAQATASKQEAKEAKTASDSLEADLKNTMEIVTPWAKNAFWWLSPEQFEALWGTKVQSHIAGPGAEILRRIGFDMGATMAKYGPYIALAGAVGPSVAGTVVLYKQAKAQQAGQQPAAEGGDGAAAST